MGKRRHTPTREGTRPLIIEGVHAVDEALAAGLPIRRILRAREGAQSKAIEALAASAQAAGIAVVAVDRSTLDKLSERGVHQGIIAELRPFEPCPFETLLAGNPGTARLLIVADHLTDAGNLGAIIRSAEAVGAVGLVIPNRRSATVTAATYKASAGAVAHLPIAIVPNIVRALEELKTAGFWVVGASDHATETLWDVDLRGSVALVVGNEGAGLSDLVLRTCDVLAALPMRGEVSSLNVAQATTACCYEWLRQNAVGLGLSSTRGGADHGKAS